MLRRVTMPALLAVLVATSLCGCQARQDQQVTVIVEDRLNIPLEGVRVVASGGSSVALGSIPPGGSSTVRLKTRNPRAGSGGVLRLIDDSRGGTYTIKQGYFGALTGTVTVSVDSIDDRARLDGRIVSQTNSAPGERRLRD